MIWLLLRDVNSLVLKLIIYRQPGAQVQKEEAQEEEEGQQEKQAYFLVQ